MVTGAVAAAGAGALVGAAAAAAAVGAGAVVAAAAAGALVGSAFAGAAAGAASPPHAASNRLNALPPIPRRRRRLGRPIPISVRFITDISSLLANRRPAARTLAAT